MVFYGQAVVSLHGVYGQAIVSLHGVLWASSCELAAWCFMGKQL